MGTGMCTCAIALTIASEKFTSQGKFLAKWGSKGSGDGQFGDNPSSSERGPRAIAVAPDGSIYVTDPANFRVQKFTADGEFLIKWGQKGCEDEMADGTICGPYGIAVDSSGNVYEADCENHRVQKFTADGQFITKWGGCCAGGGDGLMYLPQGIAVGTNGAVYVGDAADQIQKFTSKGGFLAGWNSWGSGDGRFEGPYAVAIGPAGDVYVGDLFNQRIQKFSADGRFQMKWGGVGLTYSVATDSAGYVYVGCDEALQKFTAEGVFVWEIGGGGGTGDGEFRKVRGVAVDKDGTIYTTDGDCGEAHGDGTHKECRVQKFTSDGQFVTKWGTLGTGDGQFGDIRGIAVDGNGNVFVADPYSNYIQKFKTDGQFIKKWTSECAPMGVAVDSSGNVYVADSDNSQVQKFDREGNLITWLGGPGSSPGQMSFPYGVAVNQDGHVYVADTGNSRIQVFRPVTHEANSRAIIVAGGGPYDGNILWPATEMCANFAYRTLAYQGFTKESIYYLSSDTKLDLDGNGIPDDVDGDVTHANLMHALTSWAKGAGAVILYLVDHGGENGFSVREGEIVSPGELNQWLTELEGTISGKVLVVIDTCQSGWFLQGLASSSGKRVVIASTRKQESAYFIAGGSISFSSYFWTHVFNGANLLQAFTQAKADMAYSTGMQHPLLDANGNGTGNEAEDKDIAAGIVLFNATNSFNEAPTIGTVTPPRTITGTSSALIHADQVRDADGIGRVFAIVRPPDFKPSGTGSPILELPTIELFPVGRGALRGAL